MSPTNTYATPRRTCDPPPTSISPVVNQRLISLSEPFHHTYLVGRWSFHSLWPPRTCSMLWSCPHMTYAWGMCTVDMRPAAACDVSSGDSKPEMDHLCCKNVQNAVQGAAISLAAARMSGLKVGPFPPWVVVRPYSSLPPSLGTVSSV